MGFLSKVLFDLLNEQFAVKITQIDHSELISEKV